MTDKESDLVVESRRMLLHSMVKRITEDLNLNLLIEMKRVVDRAVSDKAEEQRKLDT